jgi:hypothetical protein
LGLVLVLGYKNGWVLGFWSGFGRILILGKIKGVSNFDLGFPIISKIWKQKDFFKEVIDGIICRRNAAVCCVHAEIYRLNAAVCRLNGLNAAKYLLIIPIRNLFNHKLFDYLDKNGIRISRSCC